MLKNRYTLLSGGEIFVDERIEKDFSPLPRKIWYTTYSFAVDRYGENDEQRTGVGCDVDARKCYPM